MTLSDSEGSEPEIVMNDDKDLEDGASTSSGAKSLLLQNDEENEVTLLDENMMNIFHILQRTNLDPIQNINMFKGKYILVQRFFQKFIITFFIQAKESLT